MLKMIFTFIAVAVIAVACGKKPTQTADFQIVDASSTNSSGVVTIPTNEVVPPITPENPDPKPENTVVDKDDEFLKDYIGVYKTGNRAYFQGANKPRFGYEAKIESYSANSKISYRVLFKGVDENGNITVEHSYLYRDKTKDSDVGKALYDFRVVYARFENGKLILKPSNYTFEIILDKVS